MKLRQLLNGVPLKGGNIDQEMEINSISYDSRTLEPGALFVALPGDKTDGHRYIDTALERGAAAVLCQRAPDRPGPWLVTEDTRLALALLSANWFGHPGDAMTLVAVTGTNGKTTTTSLIKELLEGTRRAKVGLIGTNRNMIGREELPAHRTTPESYELQALLRQMLDNGCTYVVMEVSSHALVQHRTAGLTFDLGLFTNLTQDHLDYHHTMEEYRAAKGLLFDQCRQAVLNLDDPAGRWYLERVRCPVFTYSENRTQANLSAKNIRLFPSHVEFDALSTGRLVRVHLPIPGGFSIYNALAALSAGLCLGLGLKEMARVMPAVHGVKGRVEVVPVPPAYTVIIDYAHSPNALENILTTARDFTAGRLICLFGCGGDRDKTTRPIMGAIAQDLAGGLSAFLLYNFHPAKVFMGDTGSLFLGGMVCGLAFALNIPLVIPIIGLVYVAEVLSDIIQVVYFKKTGGKRFFRMAPLHHHLEMGIILSISRQIPAPKKD